MFESSSVDVVAADERFRCSVPWTVLPSRPARSRRSRRSPLDGASCAASGAGGLAEMVTPVPFLAELARRGVKAAVFEGAAAS